MREFAAVLIGLCLWGSVALAGEGESEIVVSGRQPGPALWQVMKDDHVLSILGTVPTLPKGMKWKASEVEQIIATSTAFLSYPGITPDSDIGLGAAVWLLPTLIGIEKLPDGQTLRQVLDAKSYERWTLDREKYLGNSTRFERLRPFIAADKLADAAFKKAGFTDDGEVISAVRHLVKKYKLKNVDAEYHLKIKDPRSLIKQFKKTSFAEDACFNYSLDALEYSLSESSRRAVAWSTGDVAVLKSKLERKPVDPCWQGFGEIDFIKDLGIENIASSMKGAWLDAAEKSLTDNQRSFAVLEMKDLLLANGLLAVLESRGFSVRGPGETVTPLPLPLSAQK